MHFGWLKQALNVMPSPQRKLQKASQPAPWTGIAELALALESAYRSGEDRLPETVGFSECD